MTTQIVEAGLIALQTVAVAFLLLHDWVPLGHLSNLTAVQGSDSTPKLLIVTLLSTLPFALPLGMCCFYGTSSWPMWLHTWLLCTYVAAGLDALMAWWIPYLIRPDPVRAERYRIRFAGTIRFLPERNGISPDLLHLLFHTCILATLILLVLI